METSNQKISDIFANNFFRIPDYQRGYAWKKERQLEDLWEDIDDILKMNNDSFRPHYTGALSLKRIPDARLTSAEKKLAAGGSNFYDIVDGQQRLTTILILLFVLYKKLRKSDLLDKYIRTKGKYPVYKFKYSNSNGNNSKYLIKEIFEDKNELSSEKNVYTNNLSEAKMFFESKVEALSKKEANIIYSKTATALLFDIKIIGDGLEVQEIFETMNNRGKPLTILEKLKNRLLYLVNKTAIDNGDDLSQKVNDSWGRVYSWLGKNENSMLDEDEFVSSHLTLLRAPADYSFSPKDAERKVFEMFCSRAQSYNLSYRRDQSENAAKEEKVSPEKIEKFAVDIADFVPYWYRVNFPDISNPVDAKILKILCMNSSKEMKLFLAQLVLMEKTNGDKVSVCLDKVIKILFRNRLPIPNIKDERTFANHARDLHMNKCTIENLNAELDDTLKNPILYNSLKDGFKNLFNHVYNPIGYYKWTGLKFFLFEYEEYIRKNMYPKEFKILNWDKFSETSIEHIMPKNWSCHWNDTMNNYLESRNFSPEEELYAKNTLINTLGNLTIIRDKKNSGLGDSAWCDKKNAYESGCYSEKQISSKKEWDPWSAVSIYERGKDMLKFLLEYIMCSISKDVKAYETCLLFTDEKYLPR